MFYCLSVTSRYILHQCYPFTYFVVYTVFSPHCVLYYFFSNAMHQSNACKGLSALVLCCYVPAIIGHCCGNITQLIKCSMKTEHALEVRSVFVFCSVMYRCMLIYMYYSRLQHHQYEKSGLLQYQFNITDRSIFRKSDITQLQRTLKHLVIYSYVFYLANMDEMSDIAFQMHMTSYSAIQIAVITYFRFHEYPTY